MSWLDTKYINLLSSRLDRFKKVGNNYNFRCYICSDSQKNKSKTRGWILSKGDKARYYCHNCNASMRLSEFIKIVDNSLYYEYIKDSMIEKTSNRIITPVEEFANKMKKPVFIKTTALNDLKKISQLKPDHPAKLYIESRLIPTDLHHKLFYVPKFKTWVNSIYPDKFKDVSFDEPRLIIPFLDKDKNLFGFQGRSFKKNDPLKYITIMLNEDMPKMFGLDTVDPKKDIVITEGPIDAMFLSNGLSSAGGRIDSSLRLTSLDKCNIVILYDNEPRNVDTVQKMNVAISNGYRIFIWPENIKEKDINDMVKAGYSIEYIDNMIKDHTYDGLSAVLTLCSWKKVE